MIADPMGGNDHFDLRYPQELGQFGIPEERWIEIASSAQLNWEMAAAAGSRGATVVQVAFLTAMVGCCLCTCGLSCCLALPCMYMGGQASENAMGNAVRAVQEFLDDSVAPSHPDLSWRCNLTRSTRSPMIEISLPNHQPQQPQPPPPPPHQPPQGSQAPSSDEAPLKKAAEAPVEADMGDID